MASTTSSAPVTTEQLAERADRGLDVDWLLHKKDTPNNVKRTKTPAADQSKPSSDEPTLSEPSFFQQSQKRAAPEKEEFIDPFHVPQSKPQTNGAPPSSLPKTPDPPATPTQSQRAPPPAKNGTPPRAPQQDDPKHGKLSLKKEGSRRASWFSSLSSKLSSEKSRNMSIDASAKDRKSPLPSPSFERGNPIDAKKSGPQDAASEERPVHVGPRRPSVLVAAGTETKLDNHPGFLSNALRRLSSGNTATLGKAPASTGALCPRKIMNIDHNRQRTKISDFDQNRLRRVAFKVDVEIAGIAAQADEQSEHTSAAQSAVAAAYGASPGNSKDTKMAKYKDRSEGAALKKSTSNEGRVGSAQDTAPVSEAKLQAQEDKKKEEIKDAVKQQEQQDDEDDEDDAADPGTEEKAATTGTAPSTRRREKKKRSEAERKERKEKKRRQAEANGLIPLELTVEGDSDTSPSYTPAGASTPKKGQPTTDPLRIYKRCCQLRETAALHVVKDQISKPSAALAEAPGTVASVDLTGTEMSLQDVQTLGDWLAVVPVRRLILDDCNLTDEGVRIILSGLTGCKNQEQIRANRKLPRGGRGKAGIEQMGVIEKLSMKNNSNISVIGWRHIALFIHLCRSLRGIDLSGIPFPATADGELQRTSLTTTNLSAPQESSGKRIDLSVLFARALAERFGDRLEELILSNCKLSTKALSEVVDSAVKCKVKRLGLANNNLQEAATTHIVRYITSGVCEGLDYGGNDLHGTGHLITEALDESNPLFAISLADCNLGVEELKPILQHLSVLKNFKFIDLSRNRKLFESSQDAVSLLRRRLPQMKDLKRVHLADVNMTPNQIISLAEIFPDCPSLAHVSILDNQRLVECMNSRQGEAQEEACAVFVSLMTAVRASKTLVAVEIEVPSQDSSEVIKALASQVVAYSLRNLERTTLPDIGVQQDLGVADKVEKHAPEVLLNVIGHMEGYADNHDKDEPAPDEDYVIASTGIVKALGVCLGNKEAGRAASRNMSPTASGTATPRSGSLRPAASRKPKDVSFELCESARKIRMRLRPAMVKEDQAGNMEAYRRLLYLDQTLERTIKRFEDEYPESRHPQQPPPMLSADSRGSSYLDQPTGPMSRFTSTEDEYGQPTEQDPDHEHDHDQVSDAVKLSRTPSGTSLAARALTQEEGRMHRFGQVMRREVLKPIGTDDALHGTSVNDAPESPHLAALRTKLDHFSGETIREQVEARGADNVIRELGINAQELAALERDDPDAFAKLKNSQLAAHLNSRLI